MENHVITSKVESLKYDRVIATIPGDTTSFILSDLRISNKDGIYEKDKLVSNLIKITKAPIHIYPGILTMQMFYCGFENLRVHT